MDLDLSYKFINDRRYYWDSNKDRYYAGVTTILSETAPFEKKEALKRWRSKQGDNADKPAERGTAIHSCIEMILNEGLYKGDTTKLHELPWIDAEYKPYIQSLSTAFSLIVEPLLIEQPVTHPLGFAGRPDFLGILQNPQTKEKSTFLVDWKSSEKRKNARFAIDYFLQASAYCAALNRTYDLRVNQAKIIIANPRGTAQIFNLESTEIMNYWQQFKKRLEHYYSLHPESRPK